MKKLLGIMVLGLLFNGNVYAKNGTGDLMLSDNVVNSFKKYIEQKKRKPVKFLVTEDGKDSSAWHCPHSSCVPTGSMNEEALCERKFAKKCYTFAIRRTIKWKNDQSKDFKGKDKRFSSKDSLNEIKTKLTKLGFYGGKISSISSATSSNLRLGKRPIALSWLGYQNLIVGEIEFAENSNVGVLNLKLPNNDGTCDGTYALSTKQGSWSLLCSNNMNASGSLVWNNKDGSVTGDGKDSKGNKVSFTVAAE
jgi:hypothetical protein